MKINSCGHPEKRHAALGMCMACYHISRRRKRGIQPPRKTTPVTCGHPEESHAGKGMCGKCYEQNRNVGDRRLKALARLKTLNTKDGRLKHCFGITHQDFLVILAEQRYVCAICAKPETTKLRGKVKCLSVDHDHSTGKVRGLLCNNCNHIIGKAGDSPELLKSAALYLQTTKAMPARVA